MRLATFARPGWSETDQRVGVVKDSRIIDVTLAATSMLDLIFAGQEGLNRVRDAAAATDAPNYAVDDVRLWAPIPRPTKNVFCLGLNYKEHVAESAASRMADIAELPKWPIWFTKPPTALCGPYEDIQIPLTLSNKFDWEVELAVVIGMTGRNVAREDAWRYVHSFAVFNDFSIRDLQRRHGNQWFKGKSLDKASPLGPWLVTKDEVANPDNLEVVCRVNGVEKQRSNTRLMIFDIPTAIADISDTMTLEPGDIIATGTPSGVGFARTPPEYLVPGDELESEILGLGRLRNRIVAG